MFPSTLPKSLRFRRDKSASLRGGGTTLSYYPVRALRPTSVSLLPAFATGEKPLYGVPTGESVLCRFVRKLPQRLRAFGRLDGIEEHARQRRVGPAAGVGDVENHVATDVPHQVFALRVAVQIALVKHGFGGGVQDLNARATPISVPVQTVNGDLMNGVVGQVAIEIVAFVVGAPLRRDAIRAVRLLHRPHIIGATAPGVGPAGALALSLAMSWPCEP